MIFVKVSLKLLHEVIWIRFHICISNFVRESMVSNEYKQREKLQRFAQPCVMLNGSRATLSALKAHLSYTDHGASAALNSENKILPAEQEANVAVLSLAHP